jgi:hypothetical protein
MNCNCGKEITLRYAKLCDDCRQKKLVMGGRKTGNREKTMKRIGEERKTSPETTEVWAKCPACPTGDDLHEITVGIKDVERGKRLYRYCKLHSHNRYFDGDIFGFGRQKTGRRASAL